MQKRTYIEGRKLYSYLEPKVYIVVLSWNRCDTVLRCLAALSKLHYSNSHIVLVDNASEDGTPFQVASSFPHVEIVRSDRNVGYAGGVNLGIQRALEQQAEFVWLLNDDATVQPETLTLLVEAACLSQDIGAVSPVIYYEDEPGRVQVHGTYLNRRSARMRSVNAEEEQLGANEVSVLSGAAMLIKAEAISRVGMMDEKFFAYWEDFDFSMRLAMAGYQRQVLTKAHIHHGKTAKAQEGSFRPPHYYYLILRNQFFFWRRYRRGALARGTYFLSFVADAIEEAAMCIHYGKPECADACLDAIWDGLRGQGGPFFSRGRIPPILKTLVSWHPFFWGAVLRGKRPRSIRE